MNYDLGDAGTLTNGQSLWIEPNGGAAAGSTGNFSQRLGQLLVT